MGNTGVDGSKIYERLNRYGKWMKACGENCWKGNSNDPMDIICDLIIDDGHKNRGHRKNLFSNAF